MKKNNIIISISIVGAVLLSGCSTKTQYDDINGQDTTNVGFNLTDLRATTEKMVDELLDAKAIKE